MAYIQLLEIWYNLIMRVRLPQEKLQILFHTLEKGNYSRAQIARAANVSVRTISDWHRGKISTPQVILAKLAGMVGMTMSDLSP